MCLIHPCIAMTIPAEKRQGLCARYCASSKIKIAILTGTISHGVMMFGMTAVPIAMIACNHSVGDAAGVIQIHLLAMYLPGFFTGHLITRFGVERVMLTGLVLLVIAGSIALGGLELSRFALAMGLLGWAGICHLSGRPPC